MAYQPKSYRKFAATTATAAMVASAVAPVASLAAGFTDVAPQYKEAVDFLVSTGATNGKTETQFGVYEQITRLDAAVILAKVLKLDVENAKDAGFTDVPKDRAKYVNALVEAGILNGKGDGKFGAYDNLSRVEMAKIVANAYKLEKQNDSALPFTDVNAKWAPFVKALYDNGVTSGKTPTSFGAYENITRGDFARFVFKAANLDVAPQASAKAINRTTVEVKFNVAVDELKAENFSIKGAQVNGVELSQDKKTAKLSVSGLNYATEYTLEIKGVKVEGKTVDFGAVKFTTPAVTEVYTLKVTPASTTVTANGADNTVVKFELLNDEGKVDTGADNIVLEIGTTFGNLATNRVTVQDGVGQVVLTSEFSVKDVVAKVTAQIIEASSDYKDLIGKVAGQAEVKFVPAAVTTDPNAITFQDAESNQADRVVLYFDKPVSPATFVKTNADGTFAVSADGKSQLFKDNVNIKISQNGAQKTVVGVTPVEGNPKAIEVLLDKDSYLTDNATVDLEVTIGTTHNKRSFTLTDARRPEFTGVTATNLRTLNLKFSEAVAKGNFSIDGLWENGKEFKVTFGDFDPKTGIDKRDTATVELLPDTNGNQRYFKAGTHSITVTQLKDFAAETDATNISTTQTLNFTVVADSVAPTATVTVESPEQFRVTFNRDIAVVNNTNIDTLFNNAFKVYDTASKSWVSVGSYSSKFNTNPDNVSLGSLLKVTKVKDNEYVVELQADWTKVLKDSTDAYYNYKFKFEFDKDTFVNLTNGVKNEKFELDLNYSGSPLNSADNASPVITDIVQTSDPSVYEITMSEPVKLPNKDVADTPSTQQTNGIPRVLAEFQGKDKDGKAVVISAEVVNYSDGDGGDKKFTVKTSGQQTLQSLVNSGYNENWKVVVRSISDDVGNTAATLTKDFVVKPTVVSTGFQIVSPENGLNEGVIAHDAVDPAYKDWIEVTFTKAVNVAGSDNLTSVYNWTLNGTKLSALSNVESIKVADVDGNPDNGYEKVIITFVDDRAFGNASNVISVTKGIKSLDGTVLTGEHEVVAKTVSPDQTKSKQKQ
ncbi:hypothetical protein GLN3_08570 [Geobacillus lituanicus]|nr:hypothetical protein GLN3_08570 [Geobacillus lituanicus]